MPSVCNFATDVLKNLPEVKDAEPPYGGLQIISGMALGWDQAIAVGCVRLGIPFIAAVPFEGQESMWPIHSRKMYEALLKAARSVKYVCDPGYSVEKMQIRNEWMVDNCDSILALWNGAPGGTENCVKYANLVAKPYQNFWQEWKSWRS